MRMLVTEVKDSSYEWCISSCIRGGCWASDVAAFFSLYHRCLLVFPYFLSRLTINEKDTFLSYSMEHVYRNVIAVEARDL